MVIAGIGSRKISKEVRAFCLSFARHLVRKGIKFKSGGAPGMDTIFEEAILEEGLDVDSSRISIELPWETFEGKATLYPDACNLLTEERLIDAGEILKKNGVCKGFDSLPNSLKRLFGRNVYQVINADGSHVDMVIYWAPENPITRAVEGGTKYAVYLARSLGVETYNIGIPEDMEVLSEMFGFDYNREKINCFLVSY